MMTDFKFNDYGTFSDGEIEVVVKEKQPAKPEIWYVPAYLFDIFLPGNPEPIGQISLRIGNTRHLIMYGGHIGYGIKEGYRGHRYAAKACNLIKPVALGHGLKTLWITCNPDNYPSRRTCKILGCELVEIVDLPEDTDLYRDGDRQKCRYRWDLGKS
jgi:tagatose 1,6-diphosphate aldolase